MAPWCATQCDCGSPLVRHSTLTAHSTEHAGDDQAPIIASVLLFDLCGWPVCVSHNGAGFEHYRNAHAASPTNPSA
jgi:hypothetical protein